MFAVLFLCFGTTDIFAQKKAIPREVIVIEILSPISKDADKREVLINKTVKSNYEAGGGRGNACTSCDQNGSYEFNATAWRMGKDKSKISFKISFADECRTRKIFTIYRNQQTKIQLNCGVNIVAYYGFESEEGN